MNYLIVPYGLLDSFTVIIADISGALFVVLKALYESTRSLGNWSASFFRNKKRHVILKALYESIRSLGCCRPVAGNIVGALYHKL